MNPGRLLRTVLFASATATLGSNVYLLAISGAAVAGRRRTAPETDGGPALRFVVMIPARDEEATLPRTLGSLRRLDYADALIEVVVVADNCADDTAATARAGGALVIEREGGEGGKGHALAWGLERVERLVPSYDAVLFLDADCAVSTNLAAALERRLCAGASAVQADYVVSNPGASWVAALRFASFALVNTVRPLGKDTLGLSSGILGTGFALRRSLLERCPWDAFSLVEDAEYHLRLLEAGERVRFAREAAVSSPMPTTLRGSREQQARWEGGKRLMLRGGARRLLQIGLRRRDAVLLHAAVEGLVPSQSMLAAAGVALTVAGRFSRLRWVARSGAAALMAQTLHVLCGLLLAHAPARVYRALALAPLLVVWKLPLYVRVLIGRGPGEWGRSAR